MTSPKQTSRNNRSLKAIKAWFNAKIYAKASALMNDAGPEAVAAFIGTFFNETRRAERVAEIMAGTMPSW